MEDNEAVFYDIHEKEMENETNSDDLFELLRKLGFDQVYHQDIISYEKEFRFSRAKFFIYVDNDFIVITAPPPNTLIELIKLKSTMDNFHYLATKWNIYEQ